jgi:hypothetical protein
LFSRILRYLRPKPPPPPSHHWLVIQQRGETNKQVGDFSAKRLHYGSLQKLVSRFQASLCLPVDTIFSTVWGFFYFITGFTVHFCSKPFNSFRQKRLSYPKKENVIVLAYIQSG